MPIEASRETYSDTLPSMNVVLRADRAASLVRFGAAKVMSRPDLGSLTPGATISVSAPAARVSAGNPNLDPFRAKAYDLSFEWYFQPSGRCCRWRCSRRTDRQLRPDGADQLGPSPAIRSACPDSVAIAACGTTTGLQPPRAVAVHRPRPTPPAADLTGYEINYQQPLTVPAGLRWPITGVLAELHARQIVINYLNGAGAVVATADLTGLSRKLLQRHPLLRGRQVVGPGLGLVS